MKKSKPLPDIEYLNDLFEYDLETGNLVWKFRPNQRGQWNGRYCGSIAGCKIKNSSGKTYINILIDGKKYLGHRLVWKILNGDEPDEIDHIDGDGTNNRKKNLRRSDCVMNQRNKRLSIKNTSGCVGVSRRRGRSVWRADIKVNGKTISIGSYSKYEDAVSARKTAEKIYGFHEEHGTGRPL